MIRALATKRFNRSLTARPDGQLIAAVLAGDTAEFAELAARYRDRVERLCQRLFADREMVRDLSQESFFRALTGLASYRSELPFFGCLRTIVANVCYDELRRRQRRPEELVADFSASERIWVQLVSEATPEEILDAAERRQEAHDLAHRLLDSLRPEDRMVMILKESEELSVSEIAETMGWSEAKVKIRAFRARQAMRRQAEPILARVPRGAAR
jgi:RNA polymerase sigma-70 factor (ECF subfamily)